jgi:hypothetical protein
MQAASAAAEERMLELESQRGAAQQQVRGVSCLVCLLTHMLQNENGSSMPLESYVCSCSCMPYARNTPAALRHAASRCSCGNMKP